jgi:hypothetical protein
MGDLCTVCNGQQDWNGEICVQVLMDSCIVKGILCTVCNGQLDCKGEICVQSVIDSWTVKGRFVYSL